MELSTLRRGIRPQSIFLFALAFIGAAFLLNQDIFAAADSGGADHGSGHPPGDHGHGDGHGDHHGGHHGVDGTNLQLMWGLPFAGILLCIALCPLVLEHFWHHNYGKIAFFWGALFSIPFLYQFGHDAVYEIAHIILLDYVPFIILLGSLFTAAGGICLKGRLKGSPVVNSLILLIGTSLASIMGTTGAAMLLIRPMIRANKWRKKKVHLVVFFIFLVANIGGSLTPLGDPPLFLGFLKGVEFTWTLRLAMPLAIAAGILIPVFFILDSYLYKSETQPEEEDDGPDPIRFEGIINFVFIAGIIGAILLSSSLSKSPGFYDVEKEKAAQPAIDIATKEAQEAKEALVAYKDSLPKDAAFDEDQQLQTLRENEFRAVAHTNSLRAAQSHDSVQGLKFIGTGVTVPFTNLLRDSLLVGILILSLVFTKRQTREDNFFTWEPILEVAKLFSAIFLTIIPVLKILQSGIDGELASIIWAVVDHTNNPNNPMYFWLTGILSSFLDNAPTYVVFFNTAGGDAQYLMNAGETTLLAISMGAVFMGANTYIGNAPNFMVKSIAEENGIKMPSFFGYMGWSVVFLVPVFILLTFIYF